MNRGVRVEVTPPECALAAEMFDHFCAAGTMKQILALHREICNTLTLKPNRLPDFYPKLKAKLASSWKAQALFKKFDARASHKVYAKGRACAQTKALIIGAGPCGLRAAIECQLLGAKVVVVEKRDRMSRNNVLHLWPFVIQDLRALGAKKFFGKFCAGSIDHISIRQLQCILLKVALLLGVEFHEGISFEGLLEPTVSDNSETLGWRARVLPADHPVAQYEFDALVGADGKRNTLHGFKRKEFRGKLAMAITANFINRHTEQEASVPEISGVAFIFNQKFFKELYAVTGIDLENIVYYKDDTHYFVMTAKKHSLLDKGVLLNDFNEVSRLLSVENVDRAALMRYAQEAARFSTDGRLPLRDFALNHYGEPDVALFDFTSMYAAENASMVYERLGRRLLCQLVGDSLLEPFWPTGSGCARGFLSALDAGWAVRAWGQSPAPHPLDVIAERESIYRLLAQTTPENLHRDFGAYTLDPGTRYPNLNRTAVTPHRVTSFYDSDDPLPLDATATARKRRREAEVPEIVLVAWVGAAEGGVRAAAAAPALAAAVRRYRPDLLPTGAAPRSVYHVLHHEMGIVPFSSSGTLRDVPEAKLRSYLTRVYHAFKGEVPHVHHESDVFDQIKLSMQKEKHGRNSSEHPVSVYSTAAEADKSHSSYKRKRRSARAPQVSNDPADYIRHKIGKLGLDDITHLARLIEGHDAAAEPLPDRILALLEPDEAPEPAALRASIARLLQPPAARVAPPVPAALAGFFQPSDAAPVKPPRRLKGLAADTVRVPDFDLDVDEPARPEAEPRRRLKGLDANTIRIANRAPAGSDPALDKKRNGASSTESLTLRSDIPIPTTGRRPSEVVERRLRRSASPAVTRRANSIGASELANTKRIAQLFEGRAGTRGPAPPTPRAPPLTDEMAARLQHVAVMLDGERADLTSPPRPAPDSIGNPELEMRKNRVLELISGRSGRVGAEQPRRRGEEAAGGRVQRASDAMVRRSAEAPRRGRRRAQRDIMRQRFEKSLRMLGAEPRAEPAPSADLAHDYGLQQYRASAPHFDERVRRLERQLHHYEEGRIVGGGSRAAGGGARVAKLAAELSGSNNSTSAPKASKPKDLMRSVGKIERDDWNMKEIERKILENKLGRPEPKTAERVPKWDREQFLGRQRKLKEGEGSDEKWGEIDETLHKLDQKLRDSGRPDHGTKKVANLATKFVIEQPEPPKTQPKEECRRSWRGPATTGVQCAACGTRVFAAEGVTADGLQLHRACFRCAVCKAVLRPGSYTMERYGSRLVCLRHSGANVPDAGPAPAALPAPRAPALAPTPERISLELSDSGAREIDEDEWTDRNFLASETSCAGLSDEEESSSDEYTDAGESGDERPSPAAPVAHAPSTPHADMYFSDDSFGYDDYSDDGAESSGGESCSRMRAAREARRREVPADQRAGSYSSEVESEESSSSSDDASSATGVSTDSEFACEDSAPPPPAITVTAPADYPLARTRSAGGLATKRALELKRRYLLGEAAPPAVRRSDSASQIDTKFEAFRSNITEFQKMLHPAAAPAPPPCRPVVVFRAEVDDSKPMPDIIRNLCSVAAVDLLTEADPATDKPDPAPAGRKDPDLDSDSLSEESSRAEGAPQTVPRLEVHDEGGELIQLDSLVLARGEDAPPVRVASDSSESGRDVTTLALTETELSSDWAAEGPALDEGPRRRGETPRALSGPKPVPGAASAAAGTPHVCGRSSPTDRIGYREAPDHFRFVDEGDQDPSIETPSTPKNEGYMELVDDEFEYSPANDRSMNFIERSFSETVVRPPGDAHVEIVHTLPRDLEDDAPPEPAGDGDKPGDEPTGSKLPSDALEPSVESLSITEVSPRSGSPPLFTKTTTGSDTLDDISPPFAPDTPSSRSNASLPQSGGAASMRLYSPAICRSASETFARSTSRCADSPLAEIAPGPGSPPARPPAEKVQEIKRERDEQTEVVRLLVLERLGGGRGARRSRRTRMPPAAPAPPPVPPPPALPPPRPAPPLLPLTPVSPSFSDPELGRERMRKSIMRSISNYLNRHLGPRHKESPSRGVSNAHKSMGTLLEPVPPVPPPPAHYHPPTANSAPTWIPGSGEEGARWGRLAAAQRARLAVARLAPCEQPAARRLERLERRLARPLSAEQQAATVAELVQVTAQRDAHQALMNADRRRSATSNGD